MPDSINACPPGFLVHIMGRQARHAACDRCRAHKLRCQYDNDNVRGGNMEKDRQSSSPICCRRCRRAGVECAQSTSVRVVRPSKSSQRDLPTPKTTPTGSSSENIQKPLQLAAEPPKQVCSTDVVLAPEGFGHLFENSRASSFRVPVESPDRHADHDADGPSQLDLMLDEALLDSNMQNFSEDFFFIDIAEGASISEPLGHAATASASGLAYPFPPSANNLIHDIFGATSQNQSQQQKSENTRRKSLDKPTVTNLHEPSGPAGQNHHSSASVDAEMHLDGDSDSSTESLVHRLSALSVSLHDLSMETGRPAQLASTARQSSAPMIGGIGFRCDDYPIDAILMATQTFVEILGGFISLETCQCAELGLQGRGHPDARPPPHVPDTNGTFPLFDGDEDHTSSGTQLDHRPHSAVNTGACLDGQEDTNTDENRAERARLDIHTALIIISCYTRIMRIYSDLVTYIRRQVHAAAGVGSNINDHIANLPVLQLGTIQIRNDTALQALLLVRMGLHMIERIERILETLVGKSTCPCNKPTEAGENDKGLRHQQSPFHKRSMSSSLISQATQPQIFGSSGSTTPLSRSSTSASGHGGSSRRSVQSGSASSGTHAKEKLNLTTRSTIRHIIELAIKQEDSESQGSGHRGIGSLKEDIRLLEQLLQ